MLTLNIRINPRRIRSVRVGRGASIKSGLNRINKLIDCLIKR